MALFLFFTFIALGCMTSEACNYGHDWDRCVYLCHCMHDRLCDRNTGACDNGCDDGGPSGSFWRGAWTGIGCQRGNVAYNKPAFQISILSGNTNTADRAVDGDHDPDLYGRHCSQPYSGSSSIDVWWYTDLQDYFIIDQLTIHTGNGWTANEMLNNTIIGIGNTSDIDDHIMCSRIDSESSQFDVVCDQPTVGRYVSLRRELTGQSNYEMNLCEIFVYGSLYRDALLVEEDYYVYDNARWQYEYPDLKTFSFLNYIQWSVIFGCITALALTTNAAWFICLRRSVAKNKKTRNQNRTRGRHSRHRNDASHTHNRDVTDRRNETWHHQYNKGQWR